ncbi:hypothetical protein [Bordetella flabilis]|uniref:Uncharacterized protein n=1 Tax=Bordetella flabilis TaxID=463014 RepID=A0A193GE87_9BORD|nr:hypothetical protein [Bordetella flabilis]ANN78125.1 hypothetical protein BAU07_14395 [Bordetella flabilis]
MKSIGLQAIAMVVGACLAPGVAWADGSLSTATGHGDLNLGQSAAPAAAFPFSYRHHGGIEAAGPVDSTAYRAARGGFPGKAGLPPARAASASLEGPREVFDVGQNALVSFGSALVTVLWSAATLSNPGHGAFVPMLKHRPHAVPYSGVSNTRGFGWR